ncbi:carbohydrate esterase family 1 protein, partial [Athelia psychrophila]
MSNSDLPLFQGHAAHMEKPLPIIQDASRFGAAGSTKRRNILIASAVAAVVIIAAIIGGVAGGLASHKSTGAAVSSPSPTAPSGTGPNAPPTGSPGCNATSQWVFDDTGHMNVTMANRTYYVHAPANYDNNRAHSVVLSYHGYSMNETDQEFITGLSAPGILLNNLGIIAVYPAGAWGPGKPGAGPQRAWQGAPYAYSGVDDITFTQDMLKDLEKNMCVDSSRLYASGKSNGGGFVNLLACTESTAGTFAAFAPVSAALYPATDSFSGCNPNQAVPLVNLHGADDTIEPMAGQAEEYGNIGYATPTIEGWRQAWANRDGCSDSSAVDEVVQKNVFTSTTLETWNCSTSDPRATVHAYTIAGLGHSWPSTTGADG